MDNIPMPTVRWNWLDPLPTHLQGGAVAFGNFDGVHRGHRTLLKALRNLGSPAIAITFDPPPVALLNPPALKLPLTTIERRAELLHDAGADHVIVLDVQPSLLALSAEAFFEDVIQNQLRANAIAEGSNFRFGRNRGGDTQRLAEFCRKAKIEFVEVNVDDVSSSRVRDALNTGDVTIAQQLLGRAYAIEGVVVQGAQRGRTLGVPTANLSQVETLLPAVGVYAVEVQIDHRRFPAVANLGPNPTFGEDAKKIEVHLLDFTGDLYGKPLSVAFHRRLRNTVPFPNLEALKQQLQADIAQARAYFGSPS
jgi:riboflavin kinase/FMN adenylyltransferase